MSPKPARSRPRPRKSTSGSSCPRCSASSRRSSPRPPGRSPGRGRSTLPAAPGSSPARCTGGRRRAAGAAGLDCNAGMLAVARRTRTRHRLAGGRAEALPFPDAQLRCRGQPVRADVLRGPHRRTARDVARAAAGRAHGRGRLGFPGATCRASRRWRRCSTGSSARQAAASLRAPFVLGDRAAAGRDVRGGGDCRTRTVETRHGTARFPSIEDWVRTEVKGWTLADQVDEDSYQRLQRAARDELRHFAVPDGAVAFAVTANLVVAREALRPPRSSRSDRPHPHHDAVGAGDEHPVAGLRARRCRVRAAPARARRRRSPGRRRGRRRRPPPRGRAPGRRGG